MLISHGLDLEKDNYDSSVVNKNGYTSKSYYNYVEVLLWQGDLQVDIREWKDDKPTKKGISLNLMRWKNWVDQMEYVDKALVNKQSFIYHLGGNVFCKIDENSTCVDIRQFWKPQDEVVPTKTGMCLRPL